MKTHNYVMYGSTRTNIGIMLRPMTDEDLPMIQRWNQSERAFYWRHQNPNFRPDMTDSLFNKLSADASCFIIMADGTPVGETFLKRSTSTEMIARYLGYDVHSINLMIGEPEYLGQGIGRAVVGMMTYFAFVWVGGEVINISGVREKDQRAIDIFTANGFKVCRREAQVMYDGGRGQMMVELEQTYKEYIERHRKRIPKRQVFTLSLEKLQPSQLYVSQQRIDFARKWFLPTQRDCMDACPVKKIGDQWVILDGHVRAVLAYQAGWAALPLYEHNQNINLDPYIADVKLCEDEGVYTPVDLSHRIIPHKDYELFWRKRIVERNTSSRFL